MSARNAEKYGWRKKLGIETHKDGLRSEKHLSCKQEFLFAKIDWNVSWCFCQKLYFVHFSHKIQISQKKSAEAYIELIQLIKIAKKS